MRLTDIFAAPSPAPDPTVALIAQDDLHLLAAVGRARITSWLLQIGYAQRTELARHVSLLQLLQALLLQLCAACAASALPAALLGRRLSCLATATPLTAVLAARLRLSAEETRWVPK